MKFTLLNRGFAEVPITVDGRAKLRNIIGKELTARDQDALLSKLQRDKPFRHSFSTKVNSAYDCVTAEYDGNECRLYRTLRLQSYDPPWLCPKQLRALNDYLITKALSRHPSDFNISDFGLYRDLFGLGPDEWY